MEWLVGFSGIKIGHPGVEFSFMMMMIMHSYLRYF